MRKLVTRMAGGSIPLESLPPDSGPPRFFDYLLGTVGMPFNLDAYGYDPTDLPHLGPLDPRTASLGIQGGFGWNPRAVPVRWILQGESSLIPVQDVAGGVLLSWIGNFTDLEGARFIDEGLADSIQITASLFNNIDGLIDVNLTIRDDPANPSFTSGYEFQQTFSSYYKKMSAGQPDIVTGNPPTWAVQPMALVPVPYWRVLNKV